MCIQPWGKTKLHVPTFYVDDKAVDYVNCHKYLGFNLSDDMKDDVDITRQIRGLYTRGNMIIKCFRHCSVDVKVLLFKSFCCSMYCTHLWSSFSNTVFRKLRTSFNKVFRMLMNLDRRASISKAMLDANVNAFEINVRQYIYSFMVRLNNSNNLVIEVLLNSFQYHSSAMFTQWYNELYI